MKLPGNHRLGPETARLSMRAFQPKDAEAFFRLNSHPEVIRYTGEPACESVAAAKQGIESYPDWNQYGIGRWATVLKATEEIIGFAGFKYLPDFDEIDLGYRFLPQYWGQGLATEASLACLSYGFKTLGLKRIVGFTDSDNQASMRVLLKLGFVQQPPVMYDGELAEFFVLEAAHYSK
ncbi:MAG TPA: N-acetyltransferase [Myxococcales bacterium]|nr:N-acetyltransferase [Myxococcales bacterium]